jgi:diamine N-acetyltransferase
MAVEALKGYCFNVLGVHQVYCNILSDNIASISLFEGAGFTHTGTRKDWVRANGGFKDELIYQMIVTS